MNSTMAHKPGRIMYHPLLFISCSLLTDTDINGISNGNWIITANIVVMSSSGVLQRFNLSMKSDKVITNHIVIKRSKNTKLQNSFLLALPLKSK